MANKSISLLPTAPDITVNDLMEVATPDVGSASGYISGKDSLGNVFNAFMTDFTEASLDTTDKTVVGAINELAGAGTTENYTYTEQTIGTWVDGKPLYRKTFDLGTFDNTVNPLTENITSLNVDSVCRLYGVTHGTFSSTLPFIEPYQLNQSINIFTYEDQGDMFIAARKAEASVHDGVACIVTLEYTKTTDVAPV